MSDNEKVTMTVTMDVTVSQGLALQAMFNHWNKLSSLGGSRKIAFYVDGDGNFHPNCQTTFSDSTVPELTDKLAASAVVEDNDGDLLFDYDPIAWKLNE